jgi:hypothetical protein
LVFDTLSLVSCVWWLPLIISSPLAIFALYSSTEICILGIQKAYRAI